MDGDKEQASNITEYSPVIEEDFKLIEPLAVLVAKGSKAEFPYLDDPVLQRVASSDFKKDLLDAVAEFYRLNPFDKQRDEVETQRGFLSFLTQNNEQLAVDLTAYRQIVDKLAKEYYLQYYLRDTLERDFAAIAKERNLDEEQEIGFRKEILSNPFAFSQLEVSDQDKGQYPVKFDDEISEEEKAALMQIAAVSEKIKFGEQIFLRPESVKLKQFLLARTAGLEYETACNPQKYLADKHIEINLESRPSMGSGLEIYISLDNFNNPALLKVIQEASKNLPKNYYWKIRTIREGSFADKLITIFCPEDRGKDPVNDTDANFQTVIETVKKLDKAFCRRNLTAPQIAVSPTNSRFIDLNNKAEVGKSGLISVRHTEYGQKDDEDTGFQDSFPTEETLKGFLDACKKQGLEIKMPPEKEKEPILKDILTLSRMLTNGIRREFPSKYPDGFLGSFRPDYEYATEELSKRIYGIRHLECDERGENFKLHWPDQIGTWDDWPGEKGFIEQFSRLAERLGLVRRAIDTSGRSINDRGRIVRQYATWMAFLGLPYTGFDQIFPSAQKVIDILGPFSKPPYPAWDRQEAVQNSVLLLEDLKRTYKDVFCHFDRSMDETTFNRNIDKLIEELKKTLYNKNDCRW